MKKIFAFLEELFPNAKCELMYSEDYQLVIAVMLSAQTSDFAVNKVTQKLFSRYHSLDELNSASLQDIEKEIKTLGLFRHKAKNIKGITLHLIENFNYKVPANKQELLTFPGIGNKSANVIRVVLFSIPEIPVDTHVERVAKRLGIVAVTDSVKVIENKLKNLIPQESQVLLHHQLIHFGRYFCTARKPKCACCKLIDICHYENRYQDK